MLETEFRAFLENEGKGEKAVNSRIDLIRSKICLAKVPTLQCLTTKICYLHYALLSQKISRIEI